MRHRIATQAELGKLIALARKRRRLNQAELGVELGVTQQQVSRWESGDSLPVFSDLLALLAHLDLTLYVETRKLQVPK